MSDKMTKWGVGPKYLVVSAIYAIAIQIIQYLYFPFYKFEIVSSWLTTTIGVAFILGGVVVLRYSAFTLNKHFKEGELCTKGVYSFMRHPIYGAWTVFIIPGLIVISGSILALTIPPFMYVIFKIFIVEEEQYLEANMGQAYLDYKKKVGAFFPKFWVK